MTIHQIWIGDAPRPEYMSQITAQVWDEPAILAEFPGLWDIYDITDLHPAMKSSLARLFILERFGGWYLDADVELLHPLPELSEPFALYARGTIGNRVIINNDVIYSSAGSCEIRRIIAEILPEDHPVERFCFRHIQRMIEQMDCTIYSRQVRDHYFKHHHQYSWAGTLPPIPPLPPRGLGDVIAGITHVAGIDKLAAIYTAVTGKPCNCGGRQDLLNRVFPFR